MGFDFVDVPVLQHPCHAFVYVVARGERVRTVRARREITGTSPILETEKSGRSSQGEHRDFHGSEVQAHFLSTRGRRAWSARFAWRTLRYRIEQTRPMITEAG